MHALKFSFVLRYQEEVPRSVIVPLEKLAGINLAEDDLADKVMAAVAEDDALLHELFADYASEYLAMAAHRDIYWKDLMRFREELVLVEVPA